MCPIWFIHLSVNGHLGCFHLLAIVNKAAMNMGTQMLLTTILQQGCHPHFTGEETKASPQVFSHNIPQPVSSSDQVSTGGARSVSFYDPKLGS